MTADVIDQLAGIETGSHLDRLRRQRPQGRENAQASFLALFKPADPGGLPLRERYAVAVFVAGLHRCPAVQSFYAAGLEPPSGPDLMHDLQAEIDASVTRGPYGSYPPGPLSVEDQAGTEYRVAAGPRDRLGPRLAASLEHAHLLVFHPRDAASARLQSLLDSGLSATEVVTLSQLIAFLSFQIRVVVGLDSLVAAGAGR